MTDIEIEIPVVIHSDWGGYELSRAAQFEIARRKGIMLCGRVEGGINYLFTTLEGNKTLDDTLRRDDPVLVAVVREMGEAAGRNLKVVLVKVAIDITSNDGREKVVVSGYVDSYFPES